MCSNWIQTHIPGEVSSFTVQLGGFIFERMNEQLNMKLTGQRKNMLIDMNVHRCVMHLHHFLGLGKVAVVYIGLLVSLYIGEEIRK